MPINYGLYATETFDEFNHSNEIGPGVYDIPSPNIHNTQQVVALTK